MWEESAIKQELQIPERQQALQEPYVTLAYLTPTGLDTGSFLGFMAIIAFPVSFFGSLISVALADKKEQDGLVGIAFFVGLAITIPLCVWLTRRYQRKKTIRKILPMLSKALRPLRPTLIELQTVSGWANAMRQSVGTLVPPQQLFDAISSLADRSLVHADEMNLIEEARRMHAELNPAATDSEPDRLSDSHDSDKN